ncbi:MAG: hypothetical protein A3H70_00030 [Candidatus Komeilibacteria bacterium RIFCSPLOWO2_02_FULL_48_11]|uniref:AbiEi antitoxin C-terminal domain-containing protein n=1 Tax=Candidatus Komeilibacteria bacterium RIFCSPLOWO2_02_FULL_48_11 TaxID=1798553 RepID=A0A1G2BQJ0_9BACT|nr:MAG: hypothetical protein A3H70_00030 [Candidatus Komeilibacteria bacterium RIFCSPLOWO2_02_FULL_48_11]
MKSAKNLIEQLKFLPYFSKNAIFQLGKQLGLKDATIDTYISRFLKNKEILRLKNGLYTSADFFDKNRSEISYAFYLANILRSPSYVSSWTALQYYNLATEAIRAITSVTPKVTMSYQTKAGSFAYQSIKKELFSDFSLVKGKFDFFIATPVKALFDALYFKTHQFRGVRLKDIKPLIEAWRIDFDEMDKDEQSKFYAMIKKHLSI